jgi:Mesyanzhinovviridae DNA primase
MTEHITPGSIGADAEADPDKAVEFMRRWPSERMHLWFKKCDPITGLEGVSYGRTYNRTEQGYASMHAAIDAAIGQFNIYFQVNDLLDSITMDSVGKAGNAQIKKIIALHCDSDPRERESASDALPRLLKLVDSFNLQPSVVIASGSGIGTFFILQEMDRIEINGDLSKAEDAKLYNNQLAAMLEGDNCGDVSRVMRLPFTVNLPNKSKRDRGRKPAVARLIDFCDLKYPLSAFEKAAATGESQSKGDVTIDWDRAREYAARFKDKLPSDLPSKARIILEHDGKLEDLRETLREEGLLNGDKFKEWSHVTFALAASLKSGGQYSNEEMAAMLACDRPCNSNGEWKSITNKIDNAKVRRQVRRAIANSYDPKERRFTPEEDGEDLASMNARYFVTPIGGKTRVVTLGDDDEFPGRQTVSMVSTFEDFANLHSNRRKIIVIDGEVKEIPLGAWWLRQKNRRQYTSGMKFMPRHDEEVVNEYLNKWRGFAVEARKPEGGSGASGCRLFLEHGKKVICGGNEEHFDYLLKREATIVQKRIRTEVAVGLRSETEGTGKGFWVKHLGHLYGHHYMEVSNPAHVTGKHNEHLETLLKLTADEALFAGDPRHRNALYNLITEPKIVVEPKFVGAYSVPNHLNIDITSNAKHFIPVGGSARRFFVPTVSSHKTGDLAYFNKIEAQLNDGGYEALLYHLQYEVDLRDFDVRRVPRTAGLHEQATYSRRGVDALVEKACSEGRVPCAHSKYPSFSVAAGIDGFDRFIDNHPDEEIRRLGALRVKNRLREEWRCKTGSDARMWDSADKLRISGIEWPDLERLREGFEESHGPQRWLNPEADVWLKPVEEQEEVEVPF